MLPDANYGPTRGPQCSVVGSVSRDVAGELRQPELGVGLRMSRVDRATVPEAAINEDGDAGRSEHEVRPDAALTKIEATVDSVSEASGMEL